jgi:hypothetical protein
MRIVRAAIGTLLVLVAVPMLAGGAVLGFALQHRAQDGSFGAHLQPLHTDGYAIVVEDVDGLLRRDAAFARGGETSLRVWAPDRFVGLAPRADVDRYLAGVAHRSVDRIRLARGPLPVDSTEWPAAPLGAAVGAPADQPFWRYSNAGSPDAPVRWSPSATRGERLALVVMNRDAGPGVVVELSAAVAPRWLHPTTFGLLILGAVALLLGVVAFVWPRPRRNIVYVVTPDQLPQVGARLGLALNAMPATGLRRAAVARAVTTDRRQAGTGARGLRRLTGALKHAPVAATLTWPPPPGMTPTGTPRVVPDDLPAPDEPPTPDGPVNGAPSVPELPISNAPVEQPVAVGAPAG